MHEAITALDALSAVDVADLLLLAIVRRDAHAVTIEPGARRHEVRYEPSYARAITVDGALGDAIVARLALVAELPLGGSESRVGRIRVRLRDGRAEPLVRGPGTEPPAIDVLLVTRVTARGLAAELRRIGDLDERDVEDVSEASADERAPARAGRYRLLDEIGRGGMGTVHRARHLVLDKHVAIKLLLPGAASDPMLAAQFVVEAKAAARARHRGIVDVLDFGRLADGRSFIVMELVEAPTLDERLHAAPIEPRRALIIARRIAAALGAAHAQGVVHRDLKPSNVFVDDDDHVKIGDFGLAAIVDASFEPARTGEGPRSDLIIGTAAYMAPEQVRGEAADRRSDLYSLGCVLFEMLTGRAPFAGLPVARLLEAQLEAPVPRIVRPGGTPVPDGIQAIVDRAMAKRREERYQSAREMIVDLRRAARAASRADWRRWLPR
ncbi:serine/threonine-protein kinase [Sandaracinus amylolyticus]|uniref:Serine/threonine-protein kinase PknB n=1 Tax=Sandaracinus amylolyticus TaxID=927083 RepID=A0A0F6W090_9BACT|nr:serine/threonine-protein kinase [Sandaracinus amylolyticus]AKF04136.1 Serine/threonine-protein kinase PknB [Sandaracinus amylolyticus]